MIATISDSENATLVNDVNHARLAEETGEIMPPSRLLLFTNPAVNAGIISRNPNAAMDLPFRVLVFDTGNGPELYYTDADFIQRCHWLGAARAVEFMDGSLEVAATPLGKYPISAPDTTDMPEGYGIVEFPSA